MKDDIQVPKHKGKKETSIIVPYIDHTLFLSIQCSFQILFSFRVYNAKCQNVLIIKNFLVQLLKLFSSYIVIIELYNQNKKTKKTKSAYCSRVRIFWGDLGMCFTPSKKNKWWINLIELPLDRQFFKL